MGHQQDGGQVAIGGGSGLPVIINRVDVIGGQVKIVVQGPAQPPAGIPGLGVNVLLGGVILVVDILVPLKKKIAAQPLQQAHAAAEPNGGPVDGGVIPTHRLQVLGHEQVGS